MSAVPRVLAALAALALHLTGPEAAVPRASGPLRHEAYVWQRDWGGGVAGAVREQAPEFGRLVVLGAEVEWRASGPHVVATEADLTAATALGGAPGLALRVGPYPGPFDEEAPATRCVVATATALLDAARARGTAPSELQVDFDCATSKLGGFREWLAALRRAAAPTPVTFTALPAWLTSAAFPALARAADGFVLQVHSLERPSGPEGVRPLCDPVRARTWVERAARVGVPFRVALPTYGYAVAFAQGGRYLGLSAEREPHAWPEGTRTVEVASDPALLASLVRAWTADRPEALEGLVWYRLPVPGDRRNWSAAALRRVRRGEVPAAQVEPVLDRPAEGLADVRLRNRGELDGRAPAAVEVRWTGARLVAADALAGFVAVRADERRLSVRPVAGSTNVRAGSDRSVAWLRFDRSVSSAEVTVRAVE